MNQIKHPQRDIRSTCLRLLARREHSQFELKIKLLKRGYRGAEIGQVIKELAADGIQSDQRFTEQYFVSRAEKGFGPSRIDRELRDRGILNPDLDKLILDIDGGWDMIIKQLWEKRFRDAPLVTRKDMIKRIRFLSQRGFYQEQIQKLIHDKGQTNNQKV